MVKCTSTKSTLLRQVLKPGLWDSLNPKFRVGETKAASYISVDHMFWPNNHLQASDADRNPRIRPLHSCSISFMPRCLGRDCTCGRDCASTGKRTLPRGGHEVIDLLVVDCAIGDISHRAVDRPYLGCPVGDLATLLNTYISDTALLSFSTACR